MLVGIALFGANAMNLEQWKEKNSKCRRYAHFDVRVNLYWERDHLLEVNAISLHIRSRLNLFLDLAKV